MLRSDSLHRHLDIRPTEALAEYALHYRDEFLLMLSGDDEAVMDWQHWYSFVGEVYMTRSAN